jgi:hypothetical protein
MGALGESDLFSLVVFLLAGAILYVVGRKKIT